MDIIELEQNTPEWLAWREQGIGGSDACAVMGDSPWTTPDEMLDIKLGRARVEENDAMRRGKRLEPEARRMYETIRGVEVRPACAVHPNFPWLRASLDGLSLDGKTVLEIKCPGKWPHWQAIYRKKYPQYYKAQIQHQLLVTGAERVHYFSYRPDDPSVPPCGLVTVLPDRAYMERLFLRLKAFWQRLEAARGGEEVTAELLQPKEIEPLPKPKAIKKKRQKARQS
jgi:putative phage-type endonuclease